MVSYLRKWNSLLHRWGVHSAQVFADFVGTWKFILLYTVFTLFWILAHNMGILHLDDEGYNRFNFFLQYFGSIQATIVLMSSARQLDIDRRRDIHNLEIDQKNLQLSKDNNQKIMKMLHQIEMLESIIDELIEEKEGHDHEEEISRRS